MTVRDPKNGRFTIANPSDWLRDAALRKLGDRTTRVRTTGEKTVGDAWLRDQITEAQLGPAKPLGEAPPEDAMLTREQAAAQAATAAQEAGVAAGGFGGGPGAGEPQGENLDDQIRRQVFGG